MQWQMLQLPPRNASEASFQSDEVNEISTTHSNLLKYTIRPNSWAGRNWTILSTKVHCTRSLFSCTIGHGSVVQWVIGQLYNGVTGQWKLPGSVAQWIMGQLYNGSRGQLYNGSLYSCTMGHRSVEMTRVSCTMGHGSAVQWVIASQVSCTMGQGSVEMTHCRE